MTTIAEKALDDRFDQVMQSDFDPSNFRLSNTGKCRRMRMLKVLGYEAEEIDESTAQTFERGNVLEDWFADQIREKYPRKTRREFEVNTPFGDTGHIDVWAPNIDDEPKIIEVKSIHEKGRYYLPKDDHINQVQAYMHFLTNYKGNRRTDKAEIIYILFGRKLETEPFEIEYNPEKGKAIEKELKLLHRWKEEQYVPGIPDGMSPDQYPCFWTTSDGNEGNCPYYQHCWANYEPEEEHEEGPVFDGDKTMQQLIEKYNNIRDKYSNINSQRKEIKKEKKRLEKAISKKLDSHNADAAVVGNTRIKRTKTSGRTYWKPKRAYKQGLIDEETLEKIRQASDQSDGYTRFYLKEVKREGK